MKKWLDKYEAPKAQVGTMLAPITGEDVAKFFDMFSVPQKAVTKMVTGKYQTPSEAMDIRNPVGAFATDVILDPLNLIGAGAAAKQAIKFKPKPGMMYRGLGEEGYKDAIESGVFRPKQHGYAEGRSLAEKVTTPKQFGSTFYAPADKFSVVENYGGKYVAEVPFDDATFARRYGRKDWSWSTGKQIPIDEGRILQKDWLRGYKEVKKPKKKAQNGIEGTMGGLTDIGFNYNGAWGGTMQDGGYIDSVLNANKNLDWVQRLYEKNTPSIKIPGQKGRSTHFMESADGRVYPTVVRMPNGKLKYLADKAYDYADSTKTYIQFPSDEAAQQFGKNYKKGTGVLKDFAMGGSIPGAVGFTYARTAGAAPANGPYAKKTKASAQDGKAVSDNTRVKPIVTETASKNKERGNWLNKLVAENVYPYGGFSNTESEYKIDNFIQRDLNQQLNDKKINFKQYREKLAQNAYNKEGKKLSETWNRKRSMPIPDPSNLNASYDALYIHQGLPQKYNSFVKSQYKPSTSKNPNSLYYSLSPSLEKEILEDLTNYENKDFIKSSEQKRQVKGSFVAQAALKNFQYSKGKDEKGNYIAYYDVNDYNNPLDWIGNPFEIYGRIYLDPKTGKPKMQDGGEMKYYQEGLDFKPKTISRDGNEIPVDPMGYWNPDNVGEPVIIPSNVITMEGVDQPLIGISDTGDVQYMEPGEDYNFDGEYVTEYPVAQKGISVSKPTAADSLRIYNMQLAQNAYYNKFKDAFEKPEIHSYSDEVYNDPAFAEGFTGNNPAQSLQTFRENIKKGQEYPDIYLRSIKKWHNVNNKQALQMIGNSLKGTKSYNTDPNIIYYKDLITPIIDPAAPFSIFDRRIKPQGTIFRKPKPNADFPGENVETFYYDPIAVKPYAMRTPEEQKEFNRKYRKPEPRKTPVKPQPKKEEVKKPEPSVTRKPEPLVERRQNVYEGTPVYSPGTGSGAGSALIGFMGPKGDTTYIKPEDYERFAVPKYGKEFIESKKKKMKNGGGVSVNNADAQPIEKLDQLLNFTNYNKPTKGGWLDKYN